jgi:hypothetical protein
MSCQALWLSLSRTLIWRKREIDVSNENQEAAVVDGERLMGPASSTDIARFQPQMMMKILKQPAAQHTPPKSMKKVIDYYVVKEAFLKCRSPV